MKNKAKKFPYIFIIVIVVIALLINFCFLTYGKSINENDYKKEEVILLWESYDKHIENIKKTMDEIATPTKEELSKESTDFYWWELKDFTIEDEAYSNQLNSIVMIIRMCYLEFTRDGENYEKSNPILDYRDAEKITKKDIEKLRDTMYLTYTNGYFNHLKNFGTLVISNDEKTSENFMNKVNTTFNMRKNDLFEYIEGPTGPHIYKKKKVTFYELLFYKNMEAALIDELSTWLRSEYYRLK